MRMKNLRRKLTISMKPLLRKVRIKRSKFRLKAQKVIKCLSKILMKKGAKIKSINKSKKMIQTLKMRASKINPIMIIKKNLPNIYKIMMTEAKSQMTLISMIQLIKDRMMPVQRVTIHKRINKKIFNHLNSSKQTTKVTNSYNNNLLKTYKTKRIPCQNKFKMMLKLSHKINLLNKNLHNLARTQTNNRKLNKYCKLKTLNPLKNLINLSLQREASHRN
jgi:hypothetical protein